jgi:hypothetical protein
MFGSWDDSILDSHVHWRRPCEFILDVPLTVSEKCSPRDAVKGVLTSLAVLSVFEIVGGRPDLVGRLVPSHYNKEGVYRVKLCQSGEWTHVTIDDYLPCVPLDLPYFTRISSGSIWPLLL